MGMKSITKVIRRKNQYRQIILSNTKINCKGGIYMLKFLAKVAEKYARSTNTASFFVWVYHQPKMPASLIKKD